MKTFQQFIIEANKHNILDDKYYFVLEVNRPESGSDEEKRRWDSVKARHDAMSPEDKSSKIIGLNYSNKCQGS